jgi:hypothetical protein
MASSYLAWFTRRLILIPIQKTDDPRINTSLFREIWCGFVEQPGLTLYTDADQYPSTAQHRTFSPCRHCVPRLLPHRVWRNHVVGGLQIFHTQLDLALLH